MKTIFILVDALKSNYLTEENMPFLQKLSTEGRYIKQIIPSPGFCERSEIFSGLDGFDTGNFTAIGYLPEHSPYRNDGFFLKLCNMAEKVSFRHTRHLFQLYRKIYKRSLNCYKIPFNSLKNFALTEDGDTKLIPHRDIFDSLKETNKSYTLDGFTSLSDFSVRHTCSSEEFILSNVKKNIYFIPYYLGDIDEVGHRFGKDLKSIKPYLKKMDSQLLRLYQIALKFGYSFAVLGDHGMIPVVEEVDIRSSVEQLNLCVSKDYDVFFDSTSVRFWFYNETAEEQLTNMMLKYESKGEVIDSANYQKYRIPIDIMSMTGKRVYGDFLWCANPGILISPDYFHSSGVSEKGMHGYIKTVEGEGTGLFVSTSTHSGKDFIDRASSSIVCSELCEMLNVNLPNSDTWKRII